MQTDYLSMMDLKRRILALRRGRERGDVIAACIAVAVFVGREAGLTDEAVVELVQSYVQHVPRGKEDLQ